jgi:hypothetical protein
MEVTNNMASTNSRNLTLTKYKATTAHPAGTVRIDVSYHAVFSALERHLGQHGLGFVERITVLGMDFGVGTEIRQLAGIFPPQPIQLTLGTTPETVLRARSVTVERGQLVEDPTAGPNPLTAKYDDEIACRIEIEPIGLPTPASGLTNQVDMKDNVIDPLTSSELLALDEALQRLENTGRVNDKWKMATLRH